MIFSGSLPDALGPILVFSLLFVVNACILFGCTCLLLFSSVAAARALRKEPDDQHNKERLLRNVIRMAGNALICMTPFVMLAVFELWHRPMSYWPYILAFWSWPALPSLIALRWAKKTLQRISPHSQQLDQSEHKSQPEEST